jgi:predicted MPP superfamily phosphohydrolase
METYGRRQFLKGAAAVAVAGGVAPATAWAADRGPPQAERPTFVVPGLDPAHEGLRVAQLSDLHVGPRTPPERIRAAIDEANDFRPDLVVLTGDYLSRERSGVGLMRELLGGLEAPTVAVLGNHDHWVDPAGAVTSLSRLGYAVLQNQNTTLRLRGAPFTVIGVGDLITRNADVGRAVKGARAGSRLAIAHGPRTAELLSGFGKPLLCLAGHTHGGQVNIPGLTWLLLQTVLHEPYDRGLFQVGKVQLYVNRGVGNSALGFRVNSPPEVTLATLRSGAAA